MDFFFIFYNIKQEFQIYYVMVLLVHQSFRKCSNYVEMSLEGYSGIISSQRRGNDLIINEDEELKNVKLEKIPNLRPGKA